MSFDSSAIARVFFFLVFPGFFAYHAACAFGLMEPVFGGGLTLSIGLALICLAPLAARPLLRSWKWHVPFALLCGIVLSYALWHHNFGSDYQRTTDVTIASLKLVTSWAGLYLIGFLFTPDEGFRRRITCALVVMAVLAPVLVQTGALSITGGSGRSHGIASYQFFANALVFAAIASLAMSWGKPSEPYIVGLGVAGALILVARSELAGFLILALLWATLKLRHKQWRPVCLSVLASAVLCGSGLLLTSAVVPLMPVQTAKPITSDAILARQLEVSDHEKSDSWAERRMLLHTGLKGIAKSPIFGDYAGQIRDHRSSGAYIHNVLSVWQQYGVIAFLIFGCMCLAPAILALWRILIQGETDPMWLFAAFVTTYAALLILATKSVYWAMPTLGWGLFVGLVVKQVGDVSPNMKRISAGSLSQLRERSFRPQP